MLYIVFAFLCGFALLFLAAVVVVPRTRKFTGICVYTLAGLMAALTICTLALSHYCDVLHSRVGSVHFGESQTEVVALLGVPKVKYEPAFGFDGKPVPHSAKLNYEVRVFPFHVDYQFEFDNDRLDGIGGQSYDY